MTTPPAGSKQSELMRRTSEVGTPNMPLVSQTSRKLRERWPEWMQQLPYLRLPPPKEGFSLIDRVEMRKILEGATPQALAAIEKDLDHLEKELMPFFAKRDAEASLQQNRYRTVQIGFILLSMVATVLGSVLALTTGSAPWMVPYLAFAETVVALLATFLATLSGRESPMGLWLKNRQRAESLRREFFRFLMDLPPYSDLDGYRRRMLLSERAARINEGQYPDETISIASTPSVVKPPPSANSTTMPSVKPPSTNTTNNSAAGR